ncbi:unnamed protein product [Rotaria socialis]|uniref:Uncharacterized protein n=1 Tax=Rotaria socialis TaxID=392032 RepID=A0A818R3M5_9BILA|nr:unnamed protein product [Rotaria socialis]
MTTRTNALTHVLFKNTINSELMIAPLDKCNIGDDKVAYVYGGKHFNGELVTVGSTSLCDKVMKQMNGYSTDYWYSSLPEEEEDDDDDDDNDDNNGNIHDTLLTNEHAVHRTLFSFVLSLCEHVQFLFSFQRKTEKKRITNQIQITNPVSTQATISNVTRTYHEPPRNNERTSTIEVIQYPESVSSRYDPIEVVIPREMDHFTSSSLLNEASFDLPPASTMLHESGLPKATQNTTPNTKSKNKHNHGKKVTLPLLSTLSSDTTSPADRLTNIEKTLNSLIVYVNTFGEDIRSIMMQLKSSSKIIKNIRNVGVITQVFYFYFLLFFENRMLFKHVVPKAATSSTIVSPSLRNSLIHSSCTSDAAPTKQTVVRHTWHTLIKFVTCIYCFLLDVSKY